MLFTSLLFAFFFLIVYIIFWSIPNQKGKEIWLLIASLVFYGSWSFGFLFHFLGAIVLNYLFVRLLYNSQSKKIIIIAVTLNLFNLGVFKYFYFFTDIFASLSGLSEFTNLRSSTTFKIVLPLAISFYTFQMLAYVIDVYRKKEVDKISLLDFSIFILFFPQLIAGPIMRSKDFLPELKNIKAKPEYISPGLSFIALGILKKVLIADNLALLIDPVWSNPGSYDWISLLAVCHGFTWQIYCDFSGYTDIARGCAFLLGFRIPENFRSPFLADSARDLWQRWHVTLSTWLRDYLYIPLGGNRQGEFRSYINLVITFTLGGLWHGANFTYILWGFYHGVMLALERVFERFNLQIKSTSFVWKLICILYAYHVFLFGAMMFRSNEISDFFTITTKIISLSSGSLAGKIEIESIIGLCFFSFLIQLAQYSEKVPSWILNIKRVLIPVSYAILLLLLSLYSKSGKEFVYFQF
jgi:alginate O-acetyltransferase complex protein AlgI